MKPAPNKQALASFTEQTVLHPSDISPDALSNPLVHTLGRIDHGDLMFNANEKLKTLVSKCMTLNKKGSITITINLTPGGLSQMELAAKVTAKIPEGEANSTRLFCTPDGQLCAHDPNQPQFTQPPIPAVDEPAPRRLPLAEPRQTRIIEMQPAARGESAVQPAETAA